ncbi:hypothetical protein C2E23DRAFT_844149 [Lenzites betulinus]|nr:hypothetical protein C2E23DRAFT_844298 [Lenzites betulinus]KAH9848458.1 hypothetical protein C2E23DRAFT_844149 [Lenzites betulinus]
MHICLENALQQPLLCSPLHGTDIPPQPITYRTSRAGAFRSERTTHIYTVYRVSIPVIRAPPPV